MKTYNFELSEIANKYGVQVAETCDSMTGYPSNTRYALIGFDTMKDAEEALKELNAMIQAEDEDFAGGEIMNLKRRDGWHFWYRQGFTCEEYEMDSDLHDYEEAWYKNNAEDWLSYREETENDEYLDYVGVTLEEYKANTWKVYEAIKNLKDGEFVKTYNADYIDGTYEIVKTRSMGYYEDVWSYQIGIVIL